MSKITETGLSKVREEYRRAVAAMMAEVGDVDVTGDTLSGYDIEGMVARNETLAKFLFDVTNYRMQARRAFDTAGFERDVDNRLRIAARDFLYEIKEDMETLRTVSSMWTEHIRSLRALYASAGSRT